MAHTTPSINFGQTAADYIRYRAGFPDAIFDRLASYQVGVSGQRILDVGTGTGTLARGFALRGCTVTALDPADEMMQAARQHDGGCMVRVPHSSGLLEGNLTPDTTFPKWDHRSHRPEGWLSEGLKKVDQLAFLTEGTGRTISQAALKWVLADDHVISALPNVYDERVLAEFAPTSDAPDLTDDEMRKIAELYESNFGPEPQKA